MGAVFPSDLGLEVKISSSSRYNMKVRVKVQIHDDVSMNIKVSQEWNKKPKAKN